jgi:predicted transcriptional regulator of viral defense system
VADDDLVFADQRNRARLSRAARDGRLRRLARGIYTQDTHSPAEAVVARHRWAIVAHLIPDAVIVDRSAASGGAPAHHTLFVASKQRIRDVELPGLRIAVRAGHRLTSDLPWASDLAIASPARTLVDNLAVSRGRGRVARTLSREELGDWVARQARLSGEERLNRLRDEAKQVAEELGVAERKADIDSFIGAALGTRAAPKGSWALATRAAGGGFDDDRARLFDRVATELAELRPDDEIPESLPARADEASSSVGFWEAYFSNYIEGTEFPIEQAQQIVATGEPPADRRADGHDVLGTYRIVTDPQDRARTPDSPEDFRELLRARNAEILAGRPELHPGKWKERRNQAGSYVFVDPTFVEGTLDEGFAHRERIPSPFGRALYMFFVVSEVHPFTDGNGRVARATMNTELSAVGETRIVIPIVWRDEYFTAVRQLSREANVRPYVRTLAYVWRWTAAMSWSDGPTTRAQLERSNALVDSTDAATRGVRLLLP